MAELAEVDLIRRKTGRLPWNRRGRSVVDGQVYAPLGVYLVGVPIRLMVAGSVGGVFASAHQVSGTIGAFTIGVGASLLVSRIGDQKDIGILPNTSDPVLPHLPSVKRVHGESQTIELGEQRVSSSDQKGKDRDV